MSEDSLQPEPSLFECSAAVAQCTKCGKSKPLTEFYVQRLITGHRRRRRYCTDCHSMKTAEWKKKNPARSAAMNRKSHLVRTFGLSPEQYQEMLDAQGGVCAICRKPEKIKRRGTPQSLSVDHDHDAGGVRLLLCHDCNSLLGLACDSPSLLRAAADYLELHAKK